MSYEDLETGIAEAPITYLPALLVLIVKRCVQAKVYQRGKLQEAVATASRLASTSAEPSARANGRPLAERSDSERLDLLQKLIGFGRGRRAVLIDWGADGKGPLELDLMPVGSEDPKLSAAESTLAQDRDGDLRRLLDRALSPNALKVLEKANP